MASADSNRVYPCIRETSPRWTGVLATLLVCAAIGCVPPAQPDRSALRETPAGWSHREPVVVTAENGVVATDAALATQVGVSILRSGGNAVDAAIATAFALAVVYPEAGNVGGGGFMIARMADGASAALDFREIAPLGASRDMYLDTAGNVTDRSLTGHLASGVPGSVAGLLAAHERFGTLPLDSLLQPAIRLAEDGFVVDGWLARSVSAAANRLGRFAASAALFLPGGRPLAAGQLWRNPELAAVLRRIQQRGAAGFYEGETADLIVAEMRRGGGIITHGDLRRYEPKWREPLVGSYRGHRFISMPPPSSGGITFGLIAGILEGSPLGDLAWHGPHHLHLITEAMRHGFADRSTYLGDPDFVSIPALLTDTSYFATVRARIDTARATPSAAVVPGAGRIPEPAHTTHVSVVDAWGNAVALTTTINELYGSAVTVAGAGFLLNDEMDDFTAKPGVPNVYGLIQGVANAIEPGKRMLSAMTPTIVLAPDGSPLLITGARGGPRIISAVFQIVSNVLDYGLDIGEAVYAPRIHHQHLPDVLYHETNGLDSAVIAALREMGHTVQARSSYIGVAPSILRRNGVWTAAADPRRGGNAAGY